MGLVQCFVMFYVYRTVMGDPLPRAAMRKVVSIKNFGSWILFFDVGSCVVNIELSKLLT